MLKLLKKILPHSLFRRFLLIILLPNLFIQLIAVYIFYERHWSGVSRHMSDSLADDVTMVVFAAESTENSNKRQEFINLANSAFAMEIVLLHNGSIKQKDTQQLNNLQKALSSRLKDKKFSLSIRGSEQSIVVRVLLNDDSILEIAAPRRRLYTPTTYIFILWMTGAAVVFLLIAVLFMRTQVRSITKLAEVAEKFGRGYDIPGFKPSGATEVRQAAQSFLDMKQRINRHVEQRTEMLAGVSHDLKTPLTRMKLQLALMDPSESIDELQQDITEMEKMVQEYLDFAKGKERVIDTNVNVADMLRSIVSSYRNLDKKIEVVTQNGLTLQINTNSLRRAIVNILDNALKYGNNILLSSSSSEKYAYITVEDDGPGIPKSKYEEVFRPFLRLDGARNLDKGGTGLGLAIAKDIIVNYGGDITLDKSTRGGLKVTIRLPL